MFGVIMWWNDIKEIKNRVSGIYTRLIRTESTIDEISYKLDNLLIEIDKFKQEIHSQKKSDKNIS